MMADDPPFLSVGTDVSAKYKGAFCEAKIKKVVRNIKCKVTFKGPGLGSTTVTDDAIKGTLCVGNTVEVKSEKKEVAEAIITKIQDCSQYTVVFDDGDITTLRRTALCLKSGRHFAESETLDQLPLTHPEHFGNPVIGSSRRGRRINRSQSDDSDSEASEWAGGSGGPGSASTSVPTEREPHAGRVVLVQCSTGDKKRAHHSHQWFPGLVVAPNAQDTVKIKVKEDYLVRSFKDGRYYTVPKKEAREFRRNSASSEWSGMEAAILYLDKGILPTHWDKDTLFGQESQSDEMDSDDSMDDEPHEKKDHFVAQLYKFMDDRGTPLNRQPTIANRDVDLYRLFNAVQKLGGYNRVQSQNQWKRITLRLGFHPATVNLINSCRKAYTKYLHHFEDFYRKLGVTLLSTPRSSRTTGRSLIRDRDKMHSTPKSASPAPVTANNAEDKVLETKNNVKDKSLEKETKVKEKECKTKATDSKDSKVVKEKENSEKENKDKENKEKENKVTDKEPKKEPKIKDSKEKETKEKAKDIKIKSKEPKIKTEPVISSEEDSADNQPLVPLSIKSEKLESTVLNEKRSEKVKTPDTSKTPKLFKSASGVIESKKSEKGSGKKIAHRRNSLPRCNPPGNKADQKESRCKSSSSDSSTTNRKQPADEKPKDKDSSVTTIGKKHISSGDKNDSDSSRSSKNGKTPRRNINTIEATPPSTPTSTSQLPLTKKPRKRKITEKEESGSQVTTVDIGDKLKVYYGPTHSESKVTYEAKVIEIDTSAAETLYRVHYTGWNTRYDEWIKISRIADNLTHYSKNKHKDKGKKNMSAASGSSEPSVKKSRNNQLSSSTPSSSVAKPYTRNRSGSNTTNASNQNNTDASLHSDSDSGPESDSSGQKQTKKIVEDKDKVVIAKGDDVPVENKALNPIKDKNIKTNKITKTSPIKKLSENLQNRIKRTRLKEEEIVCPKGRDFDLNEIRSELKGLDNAKKSPIKEMSKLDSSNQMLKSDDVKIFKIDKTPEKIAEDIYEFKEPEPFEFEARKSEEKKKRVPRLFDDISHLKMSPSASPEKISLHEIEKPQIKYNFETVYGKVCHSDGFQSHNSNPVNTKCEVKSTLFTDVGGEYTADRSILSDADDIQDTSFTYQPEAIAESPSYIPIFKGFTPAKNQETYSKKYSNIKVRDVEDDFTNSPIKGEQSSDEDPINAAIKRVNAHPMSDDSNDGDLLIKTAVPVQLTAPLSTFASDTSETILKENVSIIKSSESGVKSKLEVLLKHKTDSKVITAPLDISAKDPVSEMLPTVITESIETSLEKDDSDNTSTFGDVVLPEPPASFLIHKEGQSVADRVLQAINDAKRVSTPQDDKEPPKKIPKLDSVKGGKPLITKGPTKMPIVHSHSTNIINDSPLSQSNLKIDTVIFPLSNIDSTKMSIHKHEISKKDNFDSVDILPKVDSVLPIKCDILQLTAKKDVERRKSVAEPALGGKSNKVLSETIQKLSSQISQPIPTISIPEYPVDDRSDSTDSDDSGSRLIIDKLSEEESQSCISLPENNLTIPIKTQSEASKCIWNNASLQHDIELSKSSNVESGSIKDITSKQPEEDSNISLLLCEETIPGSPAPETLNESGRSLSKSKVVKNELSYVSTPAASSDSSHKESSHKGLIRERDLLREGRECGILRNERDSVCINKPVVDTVLDNTPPTTPESSDGTISPLRDQNNSDPDNRCDLKNSDDDNRILMLSKKGHELDKSHSNSNIRNSSPNSPGAGPRRGRRPRGCRLSDSEDQIITSFSQSNHRPTKYNFYVDLDPLLDGAARISLITTRLTELRKVYHDLKAELATIDRRRKKIRRKEREAIKAAKAACS